MNKKLFSLRVIGLFAVVNLLAPAVWATAWYVESSTGNDAFDGLSPQTAFKTLQKGIDAAKEGDEVVVGDGVYSPIKVSNKPHGIIIRSVNGSAKTIIDGGGKDTCASLYGGGEEAATTLKGFTLRNGTKGVVSGTVVDCVISNNIATGTYDYGGGSSFSTLISCHVVGNVAGYGGGLYPGGVGCAENCIFKDNKATQYGGAIYSIEEIPFVNCVFENNAAKSYANS